ncbi:MAG: glycosyltransferase [Oscillospiraceae bacterium]|nr:glycosyltransferase [Oscillospiraceae bacterium]
MKIFVIGEIRGAYRTKNLLHTLIDNKKISCRYNSFYVPQSGIKRFIYKLFLFPGEFFDLLRSDVVFVAAMQHDNKLIKTAHFLKKRIITDFYISFYDTEVNDRKICRKDSKRARMLRNCDRYALQNSDTLLFLNSSEARLFCSAVDVDVKSINAKVIPLCIDEKEPVKLDYFTGKRDVLNLCWTGTYIPLQGLEKIIKAMKILKQKKVGCHLYIWGDTDEKAKPYSDMIDEYDLNDMITVHNEWGNVDKWKSFIVDTCDVSMGIFGDSDKARTVLANKVVDGAAFRSPVVTAESDGLYEYFDGKNDLFAVHNTPEAIADEIEKISMMSYDQINEHVDRSYGIYKNNFTYSSYRDTIYKLIGLE